ncbi:MAG: hypothetical protein DCC75_07650, partial [Proteobacteria bacterium]
MDFASTWVIRLRRTARRSAHMARAVFTAPALAALRSFWGSRVRTLARYLAWKVCLNFKLYKLSQRYLPPARFIGIAAERIAAAHLRSLGHHILRKNWRIPSGELDLIVRDGHSLAFVEVKARALGAIDQA